MIQLTTIEKNFNNIDKNTNSIDKITITTADKNFIQITFVYL